VLTNAEPILLEQSDRQLLTDIFEPTDSDSPFNPYRLYVLLRNFMDNPKFYGQQYIKSHMFKLYRDEEQQKNADLTTQMTAFENEYDRLLALDRKYHSEQPTPESLKFQREIRLRMREVEDEILDKRKIIQEKDRWLTECSKNSDDKERDRKKREHKKRERKKREERNRQAILNLTDYMIIERWGIGGGLRDPVDNFCANCINTLDEQFLKVRGDGKRLPPLAAIDKTVPHELKLTYTCIHLFYNLIGFLKASTRIGLILKGKAPPLSVNDIEFIAPRDGINPTDLQVKAMSQLPTLESKDVLMYVGSQLPQAISNLKSLNELLKVVIAQLTNLSMQLHANLDKPNRKLLTLTITTIQNFQTRSYELYVPLDQILKKYLPDMVVESGVGTLNPLDLNGLSPPGSPREGSNTSDISRDYTQQGPYRHGFDGHEHRSKASSPKVRSPKARSPKKIHSPKSNSSKPSSPRKDEINVSALSLSLTRPPRQSPGQSGTVSPEPANPAKKGSAPPGIDKETLLGWQDVLSSTRRKSSSEIAGRVEGRRKNSISLYLPGPPPLALMSPTGTASAATSPTGTASAATSPTGTASAATSPTGTAGAATSPTGTASAATSPTGTVSAATSPTGTASAATSPTGTAGAATSPTGTAGAATEHKSPSGGEDSRRSRSLGKVLSLSALRPR
jgi:hypothetical protein